MEKFNILVTSSGFNDINNFVSDEMKKLYKNISKDKKVMILSNAAPEGTGNFIARKNVKENFLSIGAKKTDIIDLDNNNLMTMLEYDIIYVLGGNPTYLIELNKNIKFKEVLLKFLEKGIYIGESAGSMILSDDLKWVYTVKKGTKSKYNIELDTYKGLGIINFNIFPHWNRVDEKLIEKTINYEKENNIKITKLNDGEYINILYKG